MKRLWQGWLVLLVPTLGISGTIAARANWVTPSYHPAAISVDVPAVRSALHPAVSTTGATGTLALPPVPPIAAAAAAAEALAAAEPGVVAARPFSLGAASAIDRARALQCLADAIYYEAAGEPDQGQRAVAQVILNRVRHPVFPATVCGVVYQGSERPTERGRCQFSFACDGAIARVPSRAGWLRAARIAGAALAGYVYAPIGLATHYHTYAVTPTWNRSLVMTDVVGAHFFHRWKGYWGTASAFSQRYAGGEPMPAPLSSAAVAMRDPIMAPIAAPIVAPTMVSSGSAPMSTILPVRGEMSIAIRPVVTPQDHLPPAAAVLDRWKDSGKPL